MGNSQPYEILTGVGTLYVAAVSTTFPALTAIPNASWTDLGETEGGVTVTLSQTTVRLRTDQHTGPVKAIRTEEDLLIETQLAESTLENMAKLHGMAVTDTPAAAGVIGTRALATHRGFTLDEYAFLFRGASQSAYGDYPAQYEVPRGYFDGPIALAHKKDDKVVIPVQFVALEDPNAGSEDDRFGRLIMQDAAAI